MKLKKATHNRDRVNIFMQLDIRQSSLKSKLEAYKNKYGEKHQSQNLMSFVPTNGLYDEI